MRMEVAVTYFVRLAHHICVTVVVIISRFVAKIRNFDLQTLDRVIL